MSVASNNIVLQDHILRLPNYIDGEFVAPAEGKYIENINAADGSVISYVPDSNDPDVKRAVAAAKRALASPEWNTNYQTAKKRSDWLKKLADGIEARLEQFAQAESRDTGNFCCLFDMFFGFPLIFPLQNFQVSRKTVTISQNLRYPSCNR